MVSITKMFKEHVGLPEITNDQDIKEFLDERTGMRIDSGESEQDAVNGAKEDLDRLQSVEKVIESFELDF